MEYPITDSAYRASKKKAKKLYKELNSVWSPALKDEVVFNSAGFRHLIWKGSEQRPHSQQMERFSLISKVSEILQSPDANVVFRKKDEYAVVKWKGEKKTVISEANFWAISKEINGISIRAVVRQVGKGKKHFLSVFSEKLKKQKTAQE
jgi:hypothetical protein